MGLDFCFGLDVVGVEMVRRRGMEHGRGEDGGTEREKVMLYPMLRVLLFCPPPFGDFGEYL